MEDECEPKPADELHVPLRGATSPACDLASVPQPDFRALFECMPGCNVVLSLDFRIVAVSDEYLRVTMTRRDEIVGCNFFDIFPDDPSDVSARNAATVQASLRRVVAHKRAESMPAQRYPIRRPKSEGGVFEERFWKTTNAPLFGPDRQVAFLLHHTEDVTELVRLQEDKLTHQADLHELEVRTEHYVHLLDTAPDATVIVGEDGLIQLVNKQTESMFGYARDELVGQRLEVLIPERFRKGHRGHTSRYFSHPDTRPMGSGLELFGRRRDGSEMPIEVSLSPQDGARGLTVSAAIRDISERKRLEAAARVTADRLASAVESIQDAFALFDAEDRLILCNSVYRRLFDNEPGTLVGRSFAELVEVWSRAMAFPTDEQRQRFRDEWLARRRDESTSTLDVRLRDGRRLRIADRRTAEGGIVKTIWDLTEDEQRAEELRYARATAEAASAAKSEFLSSMSHELRTPMNAILGFAQLLMRDRKEPLSSRHRERVDHILRGGEHLLRLIDDVLDLSRIEAGRVSISIEPVHVHEVLEEVHRTLEPLAAHYGAVLTAPALPPELPPVRVDRIRFAQILMNFGSNAVKYNRPSGQVNFTVARADEDRIRITVSDTGMGIPADKQDKLFQPFQRAGQETGPIEGTGIGLVITKRLAEMMGGEVGFFSVAGEGSSFWVDIPVATGLARPLQLKSVVAPSERAPQAARRVVLYVEDNPANVSFMRDLMSSFEHIDLVTMPSAELGIEFARARRPEAIIMDINLPGMSGVDAMRVLRKLPDTTDIPVIALTAAASERDKQRGIEAGFFRYLTKPIKIDELLEALELLLKP